MKYSVSIILTLFIVLAMGCTPQNEVVVDQTHAFDAKGWHRFTDVEYEFDIVNKEKPHSLTLHFHVDTTARDKRVRFQALLDVAGSEYFSSFDINELDEIEAEVDAEGKAFIRVSAVVLPQQYFGQEGPYILRVRPLMSHLYTHHIQSVQLIVQEIDG